MAEFDAWLRRIAIVVAIVLAGVILMVLTPSQGPPQGGSTQTVTAKP